MIKFENGRVYRAGENEFYRWGKKARERATAALTPNKKGFYSIPADGGRYWTFGTSIGKYGEFARIYAFQLMAAASCGPRSERRKLKNS